MSTANANLRQRVIQAIDPLITTSASLRTHNSGSKVAILSQIGRLQYLHRIDTIDRNAQSKVTGSRIGYIDRIDDQSTVLLVQTGDLHAAIRCTNYSRNQGESIDQACRPQWAYRRFTYR